MESAGLKEWAIVCQATGRGEQSIILRKGGTEIRRMSIVGNVAGIPARHAIRASVE